MSYKLVYKFDGKEKVECNNDPKVLREILNALEESGVKYFFELFNDGGIKLDSSEEQEKEREEEKKKKHK